MQDTPLEPADELVIRGLFQDQGGAPIAGAMVHFAFLGDPPANCGTSFCLDAGPAQTDGSGQFSMALSNLDEIYAHKGPPGAWRKGCFLVLAVKDSRTMGVVIASGDELASSPQCLTALPSVDVQGTVVDESGLPVVNAKVEVERYRVFVGRGKYPGAPVNFWLYKTSLHAEGGREQVVDLVAVTGPDGSFIIPNCPAMPGNLDLEIAHPAYSTLESCYFPHQPSMRLVMQAGATVRIAASLPDGAPAVGFRFCAWGLPDDAHRGTARSGVTDERGHCELRSLPPGDYTVEYLGGGPEPWAVRRVAVSRLTKGEQRELKVRAVAGAILCGQVCDAVTKEPMRHAEVRFESASDPGTIPTSQTVHTDVEGRFTCRYAIAPGPLDVCVSILHHGRPWGERHRITVGTDSRMELAYNLPPPPVDHAPRE